MDGIPQTPLAGGAVNVPAGTVTFKLGVHTRLTTGAFWDIDEFRLVNRAASAAEVLAWSQSDLAAESAYGAGCNGRLAAFGGLPRLGNQGYGLTVGGPPNTPFLLGIGLDRLRFESFSACAGVYARLDLEPGVLDGRPREWGTTNVDFNTPMRAALSVDHVQKIVANPIASPSSPRAISWSPSRSGSAMSARDIASRSESEGATS